MKVAFISEYFPPFAPGGAEWSNFFLAKNLAKKGIDIIVITPNLGALDKEEANGFIIKRIPFYLKPRNFKSLPGNFSFTNPLWLLWATYYYYLYLKTENVDIIHVQGKYSIPPIILANLFLKKPVVATIRDYYTICNYGMCLLRGDKGCNILDYYLKDFVEYFKTYVPNKNIYILVINLFFSFYGRLSTYYLKFFVNNLDQLTTMSYKQKAILEKNNIKPSIKVIRNSFDFKKIKKIKKENIILFVGRLTIGKGVQLVINAMDKVLRVFPDFIFYFAGSGTMETRLREMEKNKKTMKVLGQLKREKMDDFFKKSSLILSPSIWPEPFSRVPIEALSFGTPVVVTRAGGAPEYIKDGEYGYIAEKNSDDLAEKIVTALKNKSILISNIEKDRAKIKKNFTTDIVEQHLTLYRNLIK